MARRGRLWVGTSGFSYAEWKGRFYPGDLPSRRFLEFYAEHFDAVEINATFYRMPRPAVVEGWRARTPASFRFCFKMPRTVTHRHRLALPEAANVACAFFERIAPLRERLGPVLVQLPPSLKADRIAELEAFLDAVRGDAPVPLAVEFRSPTWWADPAAAESLSRRGAVWVAAHSTHREVPLRVTARQSYWRFHGTEGFARGAYGRERLVPFARQMRGLLDDGIDVWAFFNNDIGAAAPQDASLLRELLCTGTPRR